jgi:hypothetical protein
MQYKVKVVSMVANTTLSTIAGDQGIVALIEIR